MTITIGELVAILRLDPSEFTKGQRKLVRGAENAAKNIEQSYENLGIQSSKHLDLMREKARRSYERIAKHAESTFHDIVRAKQAMVAQLNKIDQAQFGKQITEAEKLAAAYKSLGLRSPAEIGASRKQVLEGYRRAAKAAKYNTQEILRLEQAKNKALEKLDKEQYGKRVSNQQRIAAAAKKSAEEVAAAFKRLGVTSSSQFDAMRKRADADFARIATSAKATQADISNAWAARAAIMSRIDEQQYGKQISKAQMAAQQMAGAYKTLGIRSSAEIQKQRQQIIASYDHIAAAAKKGSKTAAADVVRAEKAKTAALKRLHAEQYASQRSVFSKIKTGAAMVLGHAVTQFTLLAMAVHRILSSIGRAITNTFKTSFKAMADYEIAVASLAAMVVTFTKKPAGKTQAEYWQDAMRYAEGMIPILENIAAKTLMTGEQVTALANAFARVGVFLDPGNIRQMEAFTAVANALPILTRGQEIMKQINTEIRALTQGTNMATSMLLTTLHALDPLIKKHIIKWREENTVLEHIGEMLSGFIPASKLLAEQWQAIKNALITVWKQTLRGGMLGAYKEIIAIVKKLTEWIKVHRDQISQGLATAWAVVLETIKLVGNALRPWGPLIKEVAHELQFVASLYVRIAGLINDAAAQQKGLVWHTVQWAKYLKAAYMWLGYVFTLDFKNARKAVDEMQAVIDATFADISSAYEKNPIEEVVDTIESSAKRTSKLMKILEMDTSKAFQKIGEGALGVRDSLSKAAEALDFTLPSVTAFQAEETAHLFEKAVEDAEKLVNASTIKLNTLQKAWVSGNREALMAILRGMNEDATWTASEMDEVYRSTVEMLKYTIDSTTEDLERLRKEYAATMRKLREESAVGQAFKLLGFKTSAGKQSEEKEIRDAYKIVVTNIEKELVRAKAELSQFERAGVPAPGVVSDAVLADLEQKKKAYREKIQGLETDLKAAGERMQEAIDKIYGVGSRRRGGKSQFQTDLENWKKTAEELQKELRYLGVEGIEKELMEIEDRYQELRNMPRADKGLIDEWKSKKVVQAWIEEGKQLKDLDPLLQKHKGMLEAERRAQELLGEAAEQARWKEIQALADVGDAYKEFRVASTDEEKQRIAEMIYASKKWRDAYRLSLDDYAAHAAKVGGQVYDVMTDALYKTEDALMEFCMTGKASFADLANSIIEDIMRIYVRSQILGPIAEGIGQGDWLTKAVGCSWFCGRHFIRRQWLRRSDTYRGGRNYGL